MLQSIESYIYSLKDKSYDELIKERDIIVRELKQFEKWKKDIEKKDPIFPDVWPHSFKDVDDLITPSHSQMYLHELDCLIALIKLISTKFIEENS